MKKLCSAFAGAVSGFVAGIFGVGGGIFAMPLLQKSGLDQKQSHAACVAISLAVSIPGAALAAILDPSVLELSLPFIGGTVVGGVGAALLLSKLPEKAIRITFGLTLLASAVRLAVA